MPPRFSRLLDLKLIALVKQHSVLYNPSHEKYMDVDTREVTWHKIGDTLGRPALDFAAIQCQIHFGDYNEEKHKPGLIENLSEYLPPSYSSRSAEKKILKLFGKYQGLSHLEAKHVYIKTARDLPTYGVTFFLVKEIQKGKKKIVPRLLGINSESILRLDENTKEILQVWPLTHVKSYNAGKNDTFTLNFGDYSDKEYSVKTNDALRIRDILEGYIDIIRKRMCRPFNARHDDRGVIADDSVHTSRGNVITRVANTPSKVVEHSFVGPSQILEFKQGSQASSGTQVMTVQQVIVTSKGSTKQEILSGEVPLRSDMSLNVIKKLNRMNSNAVKINTLLGEAPEQNSAEVRNIIASMEQDLPIIKAGIQETADKQTSEDAKKRILSELRELEDLLDKLSRASKEDNMDSEEFRDHARQIADLTTKMYFSLDPNTRRSSRLIRRSCGSFIADEKMEGTLRRASFIAASGGASHAIDTATDILKEKYNVRPLSDQEVFNLETSAVNKLGKLNAAVALFLMSHADPSSIDYATAVKSMNTIKELLPELANDAKSLSHAYGGDVGQEILDEVKALCDAARNVCMLTGCEDREKIQKAVNNYADGSGKLVYIFGHRNPRVNPDKENEIVELAKQVGDMTTLLLVCANEVAERAPHSPPAAGVDAAGVRCAHAARDLLACAQLTAPTIREAHCQSALTAAAEQLSSSERGVARACKPLVDSPDQQPVARELAACSANLDKALDALNNAYAGLEDMEIEENEVSPEEAQKLRFVVSVNTARGTFKQAMDQLHKPLRHAALTEDQVNKLHDDISQKMALTNASVASLLQAKSDAQNPDYDTAEQAITTIAELTPHVVEDSRSLISTCKDERGRQAMLNDIRAWCQGIDDVCASSATDDAPDLEEAAKKFAQASKKLSFVFSPRARKAREQLMMELFNSAHKEAMQMVDDSNKLAEAVGGANGIKLRDLGNAVHDSAQALHTTLMVTSPSMEEERCRGVVMSASSALETAAARLAAEAASLRDDETGCQVLAAQLQTHTQHVARHAKALARALAAARHTLEQPHQPTVEKMEETPTEKAQRLRFMISASAARGKAQEVDRILEQPATVVKLDETQAKQLEDKRARQLGAVNAAVAILLQAKTDQNNPDYNAAEQAMETVSELMPGIINDTKALSGVCGDEKARLAMMADIKAWCDAIQAVCASASQESLADFVDTAQQFADTSSKLNFVFNPRRISPQGQQVMSSSRLACDAAQQMGADARNAADALQPLDAARLALHATGLQRAANALHATAQLTAPCLEEAGSRSALEASSSHVGAEAGRLVAHVGAHASPRCRDLAPALGAQREQLDRALDTIKDICHTPEDMEIQENEVSPEEAQKLRFVVSVNTARGTYKQAMDQLHKPLPHATLTEDQVNKLHDDISQKMALTNASVASLLQAKSDAQSPHYDTAEQAITTITGLTPHVVEDARSLISTCKDERGRQAMLNDIRAWCQGIDDVCASSATDDAPDLEEAAKKFAQASKKLSFVFSPRARKAREQLMMELFNSAHKEAMQMVDDSNKLAEAVGGANGIKLRDLGNAVHDSAQALHTTLMVTSPSMEEERCRGVVMSASSALETAAARLAAEAASLRDDETGCQVLAAQLQTHTQHVARHAKALARALAAARHTLEQPHQPTVEKMEETPTEKAQRLRFMISASAARGKAQEVDRILEQPATVVKLDETQAKQLEDKRARQLGAVNAAVAILLQAKTDQNNPDYNAAEQAMETVSELMPGIINDTKALSGMCGDEKARLAMMADIKAWCDAIQAVCASASQESLADFVDTAQQFADTSSKLNFVFNPRRISPQGQQVMSSSRLACDAAQQMAADARNAADALQPLDAARLALHATGLQRAANALHATAQLTAPCLEEAGSRSALEASSSHVGAEAGRLVAHVGAHASPRCRDLAPALGAQREQLDRALDTIKDICHTSEAVYDPIKHKQRLQFVSSLSTAKTNVHALDNLLKRSIVISIDPCSSNSSYSAVDNSSDVQESLAKDISRVNASVATLLLAKTDTDNPDFATAEESMSTISELLPFIVKDASALSRTCQDGGKCNAMVQELQEWSGALRGVCASADQGELKDVEEAAQKLAAATNKMQLIVGGCRKPSREHEVKQTAREASAVAQGMADHTVRVAAGEGKGVGGCRRLPPLAARAQLLAGAARNLVAAAQLTAPSIQEPESQLALVNSANNLSTTASLLVEEAKFSPDPSFEILAGALENDQKKLDAVLQDLKDICSNRQISRETIKAQKLRFAKSSATAEKKVKEAENLLNQPASGVKLDDKDTKDVQEKLVAAMAQVNASLASLINAKSDPHQPNYETAQNSLETISELIPDIISDTKALSSTCKDDATREATMRDMREWCDAIREVCATAGHDDAKELNKSALKLSNATQKLRFVISTRQNPIKKQQILQLSNSACDKAKQIVEETQRVAKVIKGPDSALLENRATELSDAADRLHTTAQLCVPSIVSESCQWQVLQSAGGVSRAAGVLVREAARCRHPAAQALGEEANRYRCVLDTALQGLKDAVTSSTTQQQHGRGAPPPVPVKTSTLSKRESRVAPPAPAPAPAPLSPRVRVVSHSDTRRASQEWLDHMRRDASNDLESMAPPGTLSEKDIAELNKKAEEARLQKENFAKTVDVAGQRLLAAEKELDKLLNTKSGVPPLDAEQAEAVEQQMEHKLAIAGNAAAKLVDTSHPDEIDHATAAQSAETLSEMVPDLVKDATLLSNSRDERARRRLLDHIKSLCEATRRLVGAAKSNTKELNEAAVEFGDKSAGLLYLVCSNVDPAQEKGVIECARNIGDGASRLAARGAELAAASPSRSRQICDTGRLAANAARSLVYTAKLVAPSVHHQQCQNSLITASHELSSKLKDYSESWKPLTSDAHHAKAVSEMSAEATELEKLLESFRQDLAAGRLIKRRHIERILVEDSPLRQLASNVMQLAQQRAESSNIAANKKQVFGEYARSLAAGIQALDVAQTRCKRSPHDLTKYQDLENAVQNLQMTLLQSRPSLGDKPQSNIVDLNDFVKDVSKDAEKFINSMNKIKPGQNKKAFEEMKEVCTSINLNAFRLLNPQEGDENSLEGIIEIDQFAQDCDAKIENIKSAIEGVADENTKRNLENLTVPLTESSHFLRFATKSALAAAQGAALDASLEDLNNLQQRLDHMLVPTDGDDGAKGAKGASSSEVLSCGAGVATAAAALCRGDAARLPPALAAYVAALRHACNLRDSLQRNKAKEHLSGVAQTLRELTAATSGRVATWQPPQCAQTAALTHTLLQQLDNLPTTDGDKPHAKIINDRDINRLLMPADVRIEGEPKQIEEKLQQSAGKVVMLTGTLLQSAASSTPESMGRTAPAIADAALQLAAAARSLPATDAAHAQRTEEAAQEMCWATYSFLKAAEAGPARAGRLRQAAAALNDGINRLTRTASPGVGRVGAACGELSRALALRSELVSVARPAPAPGAPAYTHCVQLVHAQGDAIDKLNSDEPMPREDFTKCLSYVTAAVSNATEFAAQSAYLISISEQHKDIAKEGLLDIPRLQKLTAAVQESCFTLVRTNQLELAKEEESKVSRVVEDLQVAVKEAGSKARDAGVKRELTECGFRVGHAATALKDAVNHADACTDKISACAMTLADSVGALNSVLERPSLVPAVGQVSSQTKAMADDVMAHSKKLINKTQTLLKEVRVHDSDDDGPMTWVTYNTARKNITDAYQQLLTTLQQNGEKAGLVEVVTEIEEEPQAAVKTFIQIQEETARKWLQRRPSRAEVASAGRDAAAALIDVADDICQDLTGQEKEDMQNLITESRSLLAECSNKYDNDNASALMELLREIRRAAEKGAVSHVVEDLLQAEEPLQDLDVFIDAEKDESKRKFLLEKKIAELMSQLGRVTRVARIVARTGAPPKDLEQCKQQTELLAPLLVKAAQERVASPNDKAIVENYKALLAQYSDAVSKVRDLCDRAVDPMDFVQTAGETMARMREESSRSRHDPRHCARTSNALTRLAGRVIVVSMSSSVARADPELRAALAEAQGKLAAAASAAQAPPGTRPSRLPDWTLSTHEILKTTGEVESALGGENIFKKLPEPDQPIYNAALSLHSAVRGWSARDNEIVGVAKRMAVLMARLSEQMNADRKRALIATSKNIVIESREVAAQAKKLAQECPDVRIRTNLLQVCERIPTISGQLKMLTTVKSSALGLQGGEEDREAMNMLVTNAQNLMSSVQEVVKAAASASVKIASQRGLKWVRKNY